MKTFKQFSEATSYGMSLKDFPEFEHGSELHILLIAANVGHFSKGLTHQNIPSGAGGEVRRCKREGYLEFLPSSDVIQITDKGLDKLLTYKK